MIAPAQAQYRQIQELWREVSVIMCQQEDVVTNQNNMCQTISELDHLMGQTQRSQAQECLLRTQINDDDSRTRSLRVVVTLSNGVSKDKYDKAVAHRQATPPCRHSGSPHWKT